MKKALSHIILCCFALCFSLGAHAALFTATLSGLQEVPPNVSPGSGFAILEVTGNILTINLDFSGLIGGGVTAGHIHCCSPAGVNSGVAVGFNSPFPFGSTASTYIDIFDLSDPSIYGGAFLSASGGTSAGAATTLVNAFNSATAYVNLHNAVFPGGEIRGQISAVPEPLTLILITLGLAGMAATRSKRLNPNPA